MDILVVNPLAVLCLAFEQGGGFTDLMVQRMRYTQPSMDSPWHLIVYADEVIPGNQLKADNLRKLWVIYFSWKELGATTLAMKRLGLLQQRNDLLYTL